MRDPVQRRPGHPRAGRADRAAARRVLHLGRRRTSTGCAPRRPAPGSPRSSARTSGTRPSATSATPMMFGRTTYNHSPSDLKHYCMARNNLSTCATTAAGRTCSPSSRRPLWFYTFTSRRRAGSGSACRAMYAGLRGDFTGHQRFLRREPEPPRPSPSWSSPTTGPTCSPRMLVGLAALDRVPDAVIVVDNASTDHTPTVLAAATNPGLEVVRSRRQPRRRRRLPPRRAARRTRRVTTGSG